MSNIVFTDEVHKVAQSFPAKSAGQISMEEVRSQFPAVAADSEVLFFDNASTSQKPNMVLERLASYYKDECSNIGRAAYSRSTVLEKKVLSARSTVADFINAKPVEIGFTGGATESLNSVALLWGLHNLKDGDEVIICLEDHHSATYPWLNLRSLLAKHNINIEVKSVDIHHTGVYDWEDLKNKLSSRTRLIALSHIHHLYGMEMDIKEVLEFIPDDVLISLDASQSAGHIKIDTKQLGVDFLSFSGHKVFATEGIGVLYVNEKVLPQLWPVKAGSKTAVKLEEDSLELSDFSLSGIVECGTPNISGILSLEAAVQFIESIGLEKIEEHISQLTKYLYENLKQIPEVEFGPGIGLCGCTKGFGIIPFKLKNMPASDLASFLDSEGIMVRSGNHCLGTSENKEEFIRVSLQIYNNKDEIDYFMEVLEDACS